MASQLFYTYTSSNDTGVRGSYLTQSTSAIVNNNSYSYSLVFDVNRRTIWAQDKEYGGTKIAKNYVGEVSEIESGIPVQTYNGTLSYFYVNGDGAISIYNRHDRGRSGHACNRRRATFRNCLPYRIAAILWFQEW